MYFRRRGWWGGFRFSVPPFGFYFGPRLFPSRRNYLKMLEDYRNELKEELQEVEKEIEELKREE
ncbi:MAG TPA: DUF5320 domain-containing protein [Dehalococcoidia bacterium]|jgi:hypothetical protein|nr:DUF5320 domain-containing protein [Dehalococcoidia bacterium]